MVDRPPAQTLETRGLLDPAHDWKSLFRRPEFHEPVIDGVRALAICWVFGFHLLYFHVGSFTSEVRALFANPWLQWISRGDLGVDLFFVISGFLIGSILFTEIRESTGINLKRFYLRRFVRLTPVYLVAMALGLYFLHNVPKEAVLREFPPWGYAENMWANILYVNNFLSFDQQYMSWCWSLAIEEQFYLLAPALILLFIGRGRGRIRYLVLLLSLSGFIRLAISLKYDLQPPFRDLPNSAKFIKRFNVEYMNLYSRYAGLLAGVIGSYLMCCRKESVNHFFARTWAINTLCIMSFIVIYPIATTPTSSPLFDRLTPFMGRLWYTHHRDVFSILVMFLILAAINSPALIAVALRRFLSWKAFFPIAQISYSAYLLHEMFMLWLFPKTAYLLRDTFGAYGTIAVASVIVALMTFGGASVLYALVEKPSMRVRSHPAIRRLWTSEPEEPPREENAGVTGLGRQPRGSRS
jgi:peptidoglycan/LPS O-acetylase OafA/YrhL